jgi:hypothetical protein
MPFKGLKWFSWDVIARALHVAFPFSITNIHPPVLLTSSTTLPFHSLYQQHAFCTPCREDDDVVPKMAQAHQAEEYFAANLGTELACKNRSIAEEKDWDLGFRLLKLVPNRGDCMRRVFQRISMPLISSSAGSKNVEDVVEWTDEHRQATELFPGRKVATGGMAECVILGKRMFSFNLPKLGRLQTCDSALRCRKVCV